MTFELLTKKGKIGSVNIKNRVVQPAMAVCYGEINGEVSDRTIAYYEERAKGGVGLIITEIFVVNDKHGVAAPRQMRATSPAYVARMSKLAETVHKYDTKIFGQIHHGGNTNSPLLNNGEIFSASDVPSPSGIIPQPFTTKEVEDLVQDFINAAVVCQQAGFDGVEVHGAHGYLITQFMSSYYNKRDDKYGGSFEDKMRFATEIITGIRKACGKDFAISLRMNGDDFLEGIQEGNITQEEGLEIARYFDKLGVDALNVSCSTYFSSHTAVEPYSYQEGWRKHLAKAIKAEVSVPVIATNTIKTPEYAQQLLAEGVSDFVATGRAQLADPEWTKKAIEGRTDEIRQCIGCLYCFESLVSEGSVKCTVNPRLGSELIYDDMPMNGDNKAVAVIGGGPSGMQAATVLAKRGYDVTLFEKESSLGGVLLVGSKPMYKDKILSLVKTLAREVELAGVNVRLNTEATPDIVAKLNPVGVFIAVGAHPIKPNIQGVDKDNVYYAEDIIDGKFKLEGSTVIVGGGLTGLETAEILLDQSDDLTLVEMLDIIGAGVYPVILNDVLGRLNKVKMMPNHKLEQITDNSVSLTEVESGKKINLPADNVVISLGVAPNSDIVDLFSEKFDRTVVIGDASQGVNIYDALKDGYTYAFAF